MPVTITTSTDRKTGRTVYKEMTFSCPPSAVDESRPVKISPPVKPPRKPRAKKQVESAALTAVLGAKPKQRKPRAKKSEPDIAPWGSKSEAGMKARAALQELLDANAEAAAVIADVHASRQAAAPAAVFSTGEHAVVSGFHPSQYQQAIFDWIVYGSGNAMAEARAGSGKTTTLVEGAKLIRGDAIFFAFNRHVKEELTPRLAGTKMQAQTLHAYGMKVVANSLGGRLQVKEYKYADLSKDLARAIAGWNDREAYRIAHDYLKKLAGFVRQALVNPKDHNQLYTLLDHHGLYCEDPQLEQACISALPDLLERGLDVAQHDHIIDYTDMLWLPYRMALQGPQTSWVFVDEAQDLNAAQLALAMSARNSLDGRMLFVGDSNQAIYGFAGADSDSFQAICSRANCTRLPLSICYRCPTSHLALAQEIVPQIEPRPGAPAGILEYLDEPQAVAILKQNDMVLCRLTAPLVKLCIQLIEQKIAARVRGRDLGAMLCELVNSVQLMVGYTWEKFGEYLSYYENEQIRKLEQRDHPEAAIESLTDRVSAIRTCYESWHASSAADLKEQIEGLFSDEQPFIMLSTVHRTKGLEADRVFIWRPERMPLMWRDQQDWEYTQEMNIKYVALTRSKDALYFVS